MAITPITAGLIGGSALASLFLGNKGEKYKKKALDIQKGRYEMAKNLFTQIEPLYSNILSKYTKYLQGDFNTPEFANLKGKIERQYQLGLDEITKNYAKRGLLSSGMYERALRDWNTQRARLLGDLMMRLIGRGENMAVGGLNTALGNYTGAGSALTGFYGNIASGYDRQASELGALTGALLVRLLLGGS